MDDWLQPVMIDLLVALATKFRRLASENRRLATFCTRVGRQLEYVLERQTALAPDRDAGLARQLDISTDPAL